MNNNLLTVFDIPPEMLYTTTWVSLVIAASGTVIWRYLSEGFTSLPIFGIAVTSFLIIITIYRLHSNKYIINEVNSINWIVLFSFAAVILLAVVDIVFS